MADRNPSEVFEFGNVKQYWGVGHMKEIEHFYSCLAEGKIPRNTSGEIMPTQELTLQSIRVRVKTGEFFRRGNEEMF